MSRMQLNDGGPQWRFVRAQRDEAESQRNDAVALAASLRAEIAATAQTNAALNDALRAWRDARHAFYTNFSVESDGAVLWRTLLDAEIVLRGIVDAMDANAVQPEAAP